MERLRLVKMTFVSVLMLQGGLAAAQSGGSQPVTKRSASAARVASSAQSASASQNLCISYTYDRNGNRLTQTSAPVETQQPVWGSSKYACFVWSTG
jgi:uncharacterized protein (DUF2252 family)